MLKKIVFMGTPNFAVPILKSLYQNGYSLSTVYTQPPKKSNRGQKINKSPVQKISEVLNLELRMPKTLKNNKEEFEYLKKLNADIAIVVAYGQKIPDDILSLTKKGFINIHASLLPKWRGAAPIQRAIMNLDKETGISIMKINKELDSGPICNTYKLSISKEDNTETVSEKLSSLSCSTAAHSTLYINDTSSCIFQKNKFILKVYGNSLIKKHKVINKKYTEDKNFYFIAAAHNGYEKKFGYIHTRSIKISKKEDKIFGHDELKKTKKYHNLLNYFIRFHVYPDTKIVKTTAGNSILISLSNGEGWSLLSETNNFEIEKNIFFGNKSRIINNESISISGKIIEEIVSIKWVIERIS